MSSRLRGDLALLHLRQLDVHVIPSLVMGLAARIDRRSGTRRDGVIAIHAEGQSRADRGEGTRCDEALSVHAVWRTIDPTRRNLLSGRDEVALPCKARKARTRPARAPRPNSTRPVLARCRDVASTKAVATPPAVALPVSDRPGHAGDASGEYPREHERRCRHRVPPATRLSPSARLSAASIRRASRPFSWSTAVFVNAGKTAPAAGGARPADPQNLDAGLGSLHGLRHELLARNSGTRSLEC